MNRIIKCYLKNDVFERLRQDLGTHFLFYCRCPLNSSGKINTSKHSRHFGHFPLQFMSAADLLTSDMLDRTSRVIFSNHLPVTLCASVALNNSRNTLYKNLSLSTYSKFVFPWKSYSHQTTTGPRSCPFNFKRTVLWKSNAAKIQTFHGQTTAPSAQKTHIYFIISYIYPADCVFESLDRSTPWRVTLQHCARRLCLLTVLCAPSGVS